MEVNVTKRIVTQVWDRYCPVVVNGSGRIKADWVIVDGHQEKHPGGSYYLEWRENGRRKRLSVGRDATVAFNSQIRKIKELEARAEGLEVQVPKDDPNRFQLRSAMADFLEEIKLSRQDKTWQGYKVSFTYFQQSCDKKCVDEIQRIDLLRFCAFLRDRKKLAPRTVFNKFTCVMTFLEAQGLPKLLGKNDRPRYVETEVEIFEDDQLTDLYRVCSLYHRMLYDFLLMTGFREQEAMYITWENVRFGANIVEMRWKPQFHWSPKAYKEREVPVPDELLEALEIYRKSLPAKRAAPARTRLQHEEWKTRYAHDSSTQEKRRESRVESRRFLASQVPGDVRNHSSSRRRGSENRDGLDGADHDGQHHPLPEAGQERRSHPQGELELYRADVRQSQKDQRSVSNGG